MTSIEFQDWVEKLKAMKRRTKAEEDDDHVYGFDDDDDDNVAEILRYGVEYRFATGMWQPVDDVAKTAALGDLSDLSDDNVGSHWVNIDIPFERLPSRWQENNRMPARELLEREGKCIEIACSFSIMTISASTALLVGQCD